MDRARFEEPVVVLVGIGYPAEIQNVVEAFTLLQDWPADSRNGAHSVALDACRAGMAGDLDPETVRAALVAFAARSDILVPNRTSSATAPSRRRMTS